MLGHVGAKLSRTLALQEQDWRPLDKTLPAIPSIRRSPPHGIVSDTWPETGSLSGQEDCPNIHLTDLPALQHGSQGHQEADL